VAKGTSTSPAIAIPASGKFALYFKLYLDVDSDATRDLFEVDVMVQDVATTVFDKSMVPAPAYMTMFGAGPIDISAFSGKTIKLRYSFDSVDQVNNSGAGVYVDDVLVKKFCPGG